MNCDQEYVDTILAIISELLNLQLPLYIVTLYVYHCCIDIICLCSDVSLRMAYYPRNMQEGSCLLITCNFNVRMCCMYATVSTLHGMNNIAFT